MAAKKTVRAKSRKSVTRAKATRKSSVRATRKAPTSGDRGTLRIPVFSLDE